MSVSFPTITENTGHPASQIRSRFETCQNLSTGEADFPLTSVNPFYDDLSVSFGRSVRPRAWASASDWTCDALKKLARIVSEEEVSIRPVHLPLPLGILNEANIAERMSIVCLETGFCPQEFMLEFQDATLASGQSETFDRLDEFRMKGFRIALDARRSACTPFSKRLRGAIERLRVNAQDLMHDEMLQLRADIVSCIGGEVILDRANWRDVDQLTRYGASHAIKLISDA